jgi:hypothetical protein
MIVYRLFLYIGLSINAFIFKKQKQTYLPLKSQEQYKQISLPLKSQEQYKQISLPLKSQEQYKQISLHLKSQKQKTKSKTPSI